MIEEILDNYFFDTLFDKERAKEAMTTLFERINKESNDGQPDNDQD